MTKNTVVNVLFCGIGGQGVLIAAEVLGWAALFAGHHVKKSEVHGMAQRGGSVESHLRFGAEVFAPLIPKGEVDFFVCFHEQEHARLKDFLKSRGADLFPFFKKGRTRIDDPRYLNTYVLGVLSARLSISEEHWLKALSQVFGQKRLHENTKIFLQGRGETV